ncbi:MAG: GIY-YIG nuclease family protein [Flavobacteriales bacterium]|nr:GIY-YIG nuclease family protein [Flavobacteriales bacterium]
MKVYVLVSEKYDSQYVGMSDNPERRLAEHNRGKVKSTKGKMPWRKIYEEEYETRVDARKREVYLKSAAGRRFRKTLGD